MTDLHVQKRQMAVSLYLTNSTVQRGTVFLSDFSQRHGKPQTVGDLVAEKDAMVPLRDQTGRFVLVGRRGIVAAEISLKDADVGRLIVRVPVNIETTSGHRFNGTFLIDEGAGQRISDVLNSTEPWLQLQTHTAHVWVARDHVLTARPDES